LSDAQPIATTSQGMPARAAIARAAQATGVDFAFLLAEAQLESGVDPSAHAVGSSAAGLFQFTNSTWAGTIARHGADHGLGWAQGALSGGGAGRAQAMALRYDPDTSAMMAAELARDNRGELTAALGRAPDGAELYLAHFLGIGGAKRFLSALADNPGTSAASLLPEAAAANPSTFYTAGGTPRTVAEAMAVLRARLVAASGGGRGSADRPGDNEFPVDPLPAISVTPDYAQAPARTQAPEAPPAPRLSEILDGALGAGGSGGGNAPAFVRTAYTRMQACGL
jgi:hypothetical protein